MNLAIFGEMPFSSMKVWGMSAPLPFAPVLSMKFDIERVQPPMSGTL